MSMIMHIFRGIAIFIYVPLVYYILRGEGKTSTKWIQIITLFFAQVIMSFLQLRDFFPGTTIWEHFLFATLLVAGLVLLVSGIYLLGIIAFTFRRGGRWYRIRKIFRNMSSKKDSIQCDLQENWNPESEQCE